MNQEIQRSRLPFWIITFPIIVLVLFPKPPIDAFHLLSYPSMVTLFLLLILAISSINGFFLNTKVLLVIFFLLINSTIFAISEMLNVGSIRQTGALSMFRPILYMIVFLFAALISSKSSRSSVQKALLLCTIFLLSTQIFFSTLQFLNIDAFSFFYSDQKTRGSGSILRLTGTLYNPNAFSFVLSFLAIVGLTCNKKIIKYFILFLSLSLVFLSGSRTGLILFFVPILTFFFLVNIPKSSKLHVLLMSLKYSLLFLLFLILFYFLLDRYSDTFRYLSQLLTVVETRDLMSINSFQSRVPHWEQIWTLFRTSDKAHKWIIGLGSIPDLRIADNSWLYIMSQYGIFGLFSTLTCYIASLVVLFKSPNFKLASAGIAIFILLLGLSFTTDSLLSWLFPCFLYYIAGLNTVSYRLSKN